MDYLSQPVTHSKSYTATVSLWVSSHDVLEMSALHTNSRSKPLTSLVNNRLQQHRISRCLNSSMPWTSVWYTRFCMVAHTRLGWEWDLGSLEIKKPAKYGLMSLFIAVRQFVQAGVMYCSILTYRSLKMSSNCCPLAKSEWID